MKFVTIYVDSMSKGNVPSLGVWGAILTYQNNHKQISNVLTSTSPYRCILKGIIESISIVKHPCQLSIVVENNELSKLLNSNFVLNLKRAGWLYNGKEVENIDFWEVFFRKYNEHNISFRSVLSEIDKGFMSRCCFHVNEVWTSVFRLPESERKFYPVDTYFLNMFSCRYEGTPWWNKFY